MFINIIIRELINNIINIGIVKTLFLNKVCISSRIKTPEIIKLIKWVVLNSIYLPLFSELVFKMHLYRALYLL